MIDFTFFANSRVCFGPGQLKRLPELILTYGTRVLIITGAGSFSQTSRCTALFDALERKNIAAHRAVIQGEPTPAMIDGIINNFKHTQIDVIAAIGGGSVMDGGKAVSAMMTKKEPVIEFLEGVGNKTHDGEKIAFIAVPTTSGTGSEATKNAVIRQVGKNGFKKSLRHDRFIPDIALVDPELTLTCPAPITAACGMDALTQLLESFVSTQANALTDSLVSGALTVLGDSLIGASCSQPDHIELRTRISYASYISGLTLANAGLGTVHGFASVLGGLFDIPHGVVCGTLLAETSRQNIESLIQTDPEGTALRKYAAAANLLDPEISPHPPVEGARALVSLLDQWSDLLDIQRLGEFGVTQNDIPSIVQSTGQKNNPVELTQDQLSQIIQARL